MSKKQFLDIFNRNNFYEKQFSALVTHSRPVPTGSELAGGAWVAIQDLPQSSHRDKGLFLKKQETDVFLNYSHQKWLKEFAFKILRLWFSGKLKSTEATWQAIITDHL